MDGRLVRLRASWLAAGLLLIAAACIALLGGDAASAGLAADGGGPDRSAMTKVEKRVLDDMAGGQNTHFIVLMNEQADLSAAYSMTDQDARGWYVYNTLKATAERSQAGLLAQLSASGVQFTPFWVANAVVVNGNRSLVDVIAMRTDVRSIESDAPGRGISDPTTPADATTREQPDTVEWGVQNVNAPQVWAMGFTGQGIVIANQDTGMRWTHNAIKPKYRGWNGSTADHNYNWWDGVRTPVPGHTTNVCGYAINAPCDDQGHGTHTTGTTSGDDGAGNQVGVAPGARWIGCRNMDQGDGRPSTYMNCFQFFVAPTDLSGGNPNPALRPHVMNNSWGCPPSETCAADTLQSSVESAQAAGIFVEVSAGNSGPSCGSVTDPPAIYAAAFSTGAIDLSNTLASFSSRGPVTIDGSNRLKPNISAPGVSVRSSYYTLDTAYAMLSGTSMAGPHVVGVVALLWSAHPELSRQITETKNLLQNTANPQVIVSPAQTCNGIPNSQIPNNSFGYGRIDALAAVNAAALTPTPTATPVVSTATPTRTSTPTATATPLAYIRGHVLLQGRPPAPDASWNVPVTLTLRSTVGSAYGDYAASTDTSGYFTLTITLPSGGYSWRAKNLQTLANSGSITLVPGQNNLETGLLLEGDADNNNCTDANDFVVLKNTFGLSAPQPGFDPRADFDGSAVVDASDFNLLRGTFGTCGSGPLGPASPPGNF